MAEIRREGFWPFKEDPNLPKPQQPVARKNTWEGQLKFVKRLVKIQAKAIVTHYRGFSICHICNKTIANSEFEFKGWKWPSEYIHYIENHNIKPSPDFYDFIMEVNAKNKPLEPVNNPRLLLKSLSARSWMTTELILDLQRNVLEINLTGVVGSVKHYLTNSELDLVKDFLNRNNIGKE